MRRTPNGWLAVLLLLGAARASALDPRRDPSQYVHESWDRERGLAQSNVLDIRCRRAWGIAAG